MPPKALIKTYVDLLTRGERISNVTLRRKNSRIPLVPAQELFEQYGSWYQDVAQYFDALGDEASSLLHRHELTYIPSAEKEGNLFYHYTSKQLSEGQDELRRDVNEIKKAIRKSLPYVEEKVSVTDTEILVERNGYSLQFNIATGEVVLNQYRTYMPVGQKKYTALKCIVTGPSLKGRYAELYKALDIENHYEKERRVHDIMREVKTQLKILPKSTAVNPDIFINLQNDGYALK